MRLVVLCMFALVLVLFFWASFFVTQRSWIMVSANSVTDLQCAVFDNHRPFGVRRCSYASLAKRWSCHYFFWYCVLCFEHKMADLWLWTLFFPLFLYIDEFDNHRTLSVRRTSNASLAKRGSCHLFLTLRALLWAQDGRALIMNSFFCT